MSRGPQTATILAIGTELTGGQTVNRNAAWLSERLVDLGAEVVLHETVPDDHGLIANALERCLSLSRLVFVTGGLGPTTDDFTRDVIAEWVDQPLEPHEPSWTRIQARLTGLGVTVAPSNRRQSFFPRGAQLLTNQAGTADGFSLEHQDARLWVLPGPPREIEAIWNDNEIAEQIRSRLPAGHVRQRLFRWQCLGKPEAELGELTERILEGSGLRTGYRAHRPYVEIKLWVPEDQLTAHEGSLAALEEAIAPWLMCRDEEDLASLLATRLGHDEEETEILDACTGGFLAERLSRPFRQPEHSEAARATILSTEWMTVEDPESWVANALAQADPECLTLAIAGFTTQWEWVLGMRRGSVVRQETQQTPYRKAAVRDRSQLFATETAFKTWAAWLGSGH